jgi:oxygen-independent coproporphyrinogen-3 oxidase
VERGYALTREDHVRGHAIERLLCDFSLDFDSLRATFGPDANPVVDDATAMAIGDEHGIVRLEGERLEVTERGRSFVRVIASSLDAYLGAGNARYSKAI